MTTSKRLSDVFATSKTMTIDDYSRIIILSDCHRGNGSWGDNFSNNQNIFFAALYYYFENDYTYIELGDGDELWENRDVDDIISAHSDAFWLMSLFYKENRFHMLYGNHDLTKKDPEYAKTKCRSFYCESNDTQIPLFPGIQITEGLILRYRGTDHKLFLTHGHQGDPFNDTYWKLSRFLVRYLWKPLELIGIRDPTSAAKNNIKKNKIEKNLMDWAEKYKQIIVCGHTHRPVFPQIGEVPYFNDGSCVHPRCITGLEIRNGSISLVKWATMTRSDRSLYVGREVLEGPVHLTDYFNALSVEALSVEASSVS